MATRTNGNVIVENIKVGDIHYEYSHGTGIKCKVITKPVLNPRFRQWTWVSYNEKNGQRIDYMVSVGMEHYSPELYDYEAKPGAKYI